jgi:TolA-binding protein
MAKEHEQHADILSKITGAIERFIEKYLKIIIICVSALVVALAVYFSVDYVFAKKEQRANVDFGKVYLVYRAYLADRDLSDEQVSKNFDSVIEDFKLVLQNHPKSKAAQKSAFFIGNILFRIGKYEEAGEFFQKGASGRGNYYIAYLCMQGSATCQEQLKNYDKAAKIYEEILAKFEDRFIVPTVLFSLAQVDEKLNKIDKAEDGYTKIVDDFKWSSWVEFAQKRVLLIKNFM